MNEVGPRLVMRAGLALRRANKYSILLLRGLLLIAVGALLIRAGSDAGVASLVLILAYTASNIALIFVPERWVRSLRFELVVGAADLLLVGLGLHLSGAAPGALPVSVALMILVVALGHQSAHIVAAAAAVGALHSWLMMGRDRGSDLAWHLALEMLFLCAVGLYYGNMAAGIRRSSRRERDRVLATKELATLVEILGAVTSSLEVQRVAWTIVSKITDVIPALRCSMLFINHADKRCFVMAAHDDPSIDMLEIDLDKYPEIRRAIETRDPVLIRDVNDDPIVAEVRERLIQMNFHSIMVIPMTFADDVLGTLCLKTARHGNSFSEAEVHFCTVVARASANALKNAMLHRQVSEEAALNREIGQKLSTLLDQSPDLIVTTDNQGRITEFNRGAERLVGKYRAHMIGCPCETLLGSDGSVWIDRVRNRRLITKHAVSLSKSDGSELNLELNMAALTDRDGGVYGTVWVGRDVTELKVAQSQLLQAKKLSSIGEVISGVAHELNNPLSSVLGFAQLLMARHGEGPMARQLDQIHESALRCRKIVKNLLSFSRVHKPERRYLGLNGIIEKTVELRRYQLDVNNIDVELDLHPGLPKTMLDFNQIQQVLLNLVNNAQQAIQSARRERGLLSVRSWHEGGVVTVEVRDNGEGMNPETLERIFDPFFTTKQPGRGTGLGLSVSYGIIKEHEGRIMAHSRPGEGTTIRLELPVHGSEDDATEPAPERPYLQQAECSGARILVVDDEPAILDLMFEIFAGAGYSVDTASNGREAKRKVRKASYDAVVSDIRMPEMSGIRLYDEILSIRPELAGRVLFVTGDLIDPETAEFVQRVGARTIDKPLDIRQTLQTVSEVLAETVASC